MKRRPPRSTQGVSSAASDVYKRQEEKFTGTDPIQIFDILTKLVEECDTLDMSEAQAFMALPRFLKSVAQAQYRAMQNGLKSGGFSYWPEGIQYLLRMYATPAAIRNAMSDLRMTRQVAGEDETAYAARIIQATYRCGNVHSEYEKMTFYVDGLMPNIRTTFARFH